MGGIVGAMNISHNMLLCFFVSLFLYLENIFARVPCYTVYNCLTLIVLSGEEKVIGGGLGVIRILLGKNILFYAL